MAQVLFNVKSRCSEVVTKINMSYRNLDASSVIVKRFGCCLGKSVHFCSWLRITVQCKSICLIVDTGTGVQSVLKSLPIVFVFLSKHLYFLG